MALKILVSNFNTVALDICIAMMLICGHLPPNHTGSVLAGGKPYKPSKFHFKKSQYQERDRC